MTGPNPAKKFSEIGLKKGLILHKIGDYWANSDFFFFFFFFLCVGGWGGRRVFT